MTAKRLELDELKAIGLDVNVGNRSTLGNGFSFEPPARTNRVGFSGRCHIGAFTYFADGRVYTTDFGRYCSVAAGVVIGHGNHPTRWLSTNPFQYQQSYRFNTGRAFSYKAQYDADQVSLDLTKKAHAEVLKRTTVGNDVWIGTDVIITAGVTIGDGSIIGAGAVVTKDVAPYDIVGGVPAKKIGSRFDGELRERLLASKWWEYAPWQMRHIDFSDVGAALDHVDEMRRSGITPYKPGIVQAN